MRSGRRARVWLVAVPLAAVLLAIGCDWSIAGAPCASKEPECAEGYVCCNGRCDLSCESASSGVSENPPNASALDSSLAANDDAGAACGQLTECRFVEPGMTCQQLGCSLLEAVADCFSQSEVLCGGPQLPLRIVDAEGRPVQSPPDATTGNVPVPSPDAGDVDGCSIVVFCDAPGVTGTQCQQRACSAREASEECIEETFSICGSPTSPVDFGELNGASSSEPPTSEPPGEPPPGELPPGENGCTLVVYCDAPGPDGTLCRQEACSLEGAIADCDEDARYVCGTPVEPWRLETLEHDFIDL